MGDNAELAFVKTHLSNIGSLPVQYPDEYQQPPHNSLRKIPIIPVDLPAPPARKTEDTSLETIILTFKVSKPAHTFTIPVSPTDAISSIKSLLAAQPRAPPADAQRLLLRGKALADGKLLREYPAKDGDTVNLMLKPGFEWDWNTTTSPLPASSELKADAGKDKLNPESGSTRTGRHVRIPSVVLSPSPSSTSLPLSEVPLPIALTLDTSNIPSGNEASSLDAYHKKISSPDFWARLYGFLKSEFSSSGDADDAFEAFLVGIKGDLSPSDIAKIRDTVGIVGMNGA
ncbi:hypothetical protein EW145_g4366 [Phellinidium pouzarii]|uniref:Ubiquitin-like domain-containing protein n=1 Tax=Phellinidium pouzarii TaxID=167371 RepID=A0A4V3XCJ0_9AGAM|nr:hypothetical protein EW145_g4366 [Phellinidium pouzarii]